MFLRRELQQRADYYAQTLLDKAGLIAAPRASRFSAPEHRVPLLLELTYRLRVVHRRIEGLDAIRVGTAGNVRQRARGNAARFRKIPERRA